MSKSAGYESDTEVPLPERWQWTTYSQLGEWFGGGTPSKAKPEYWVDGAIPWFSPKDMGELELHNSQDHIAENALTETPARLIEAGSLLFVVRSGILRRILPVALTMVDAAVNQDMKALTPSRFVYGKYLLYVTLSQREEIRQRCKKAGTTVESIQVPLLQDFRVPLPPVTEQRRIVEKIEELFTKLDAGVRSLEQARAQLKSYRRSVLKAAVEGELSREWREAHRKEIESVSDLSQSSIQPPHGWDFKSLDELAVASKDAIKRGPFGSAIKKEFFVPAGYKVYEQKNAIYDDCSLGKYYIDEKKFKELSRFRVQRGDILMSCSGTIGKVTMIPDDYEEGVINQALLKISLNPCVASRHYFKYMFQTKLAEVLKENTRGSAMKNIASVKVLKEIQFPFPSLQEQQFILSEIERFLSIIDKLEATVEASLKQANALRQSILKQAFSGQLVPQNPDDEPASALLERIREERQANKQKAGKGRRGKIGSVEREHVEQGGLI